jgi:hypothetical protein
MVDLIRCRCGRCTEMILPKDKKGRPHYFVSGHNSFGNFKEKNHNWMGGRISHRTHGHYYYLIKAEAHPKADKRGYVHEHIIVMEKHIGRYLTDTEQVHHINNNGLDNRLENLVLFANFGEHMKHHAKSWPRNRGKFIRS